MKNIHNTIEENSASGNAFGELFQVLDEFRSSSRNMLENHITPKAGQRRENAMIRFLGNTRGAQNGISRAQISDFKKIFEKPKAEDLSKLIQNEKMKAKQDTKLLLKKVAIVSKDERNLFN